MSSVYSRLRQDFILDITNKFKNRIGNELTIENMILIIDKLTQCYVPILDEIDSISLDFIDDYMILSYECITNHSRDGFEVKVKDNEIHSKVYEFFLKNEKQTRNYTSSINLDRENISIINKFVNDLSYEIKQSWIK